MKKFLAIILVLILAISFVACDDNEPQEEKEVLDMETDLTVDYEGQIGLYFFGINVDDYKRSNEAKNDINYFDPSKPTMLFFHGWKPGASPENEGLASDICLSSEVFETASGVTTRNTVQLFKDAGYNIGNMDWSNYAGDLFSMYGQIWASFDGGHSIACMFAKEYLVFFKDYEQKVLFSAHSFGAHSSVATAYLLYKYKEFGMADDVALPTRLSIADPYIGDTTMAATDKAAFMTIDNAKEPINGRYPAVMFADALEYLNGYGTAIDIYGGMPFAYDAIFINGTRTYGKDVIAEMRAETLEKLHKNATWNIMRGLQTKYGLVGTDVHVYTLEWMLLTFFNDVNVDPNGNEVPTMALSDEKIKSLYGHYYMEINDNFDIENVTIVEFTEWPEDWNDFSDLEAYIND